MMDNVINIRAKRALSVARADIARRQGGASMTGSAAGAEIAPDLLRGAAEIAAFLYGTPAAARRVYALRARDRLPLVRIGGRLCARRSILRAWLAERERDAAQGR
jgi:hypothetical protein